MPQDQTTVFMDHIRENASQYFTGFDSREIEVKFKERQERPASILYQFSVGNKVKNHGILVKVPLNRDRWMSESTEPSYYKPSLYPKTGTSDVHKLGYTALRSISEYFSSLGKQDLGTVRVLDYLPDHQAIITEACGDPSLRQLFLKTSRFRGGIPYRELVPPIRNVGRWLRLYHEMSKEEDVQIRHAHRHDYIEAVNKLTDYLGAASNDQPFFQKVAETLERSATKILPESLPLGLGHGDFAMRNILVGKGARITVIDTFAKWRTPIYEDIGYFLSALKMTAPQVISQGLVFSPKQFATYEQAFLEGYFETEPIPYSAIQLFEILSLLDKWSSVVAHYYQRRGKFKNFRTLKSILTKRYFKISTKTLLRKIVENRDKYPLPGS
jgi:hypothetical protein